MNTKILVEINSTSGAFGFKTFASREAAIAFCTKLSKISKTLNAFIRTTSFEMNTTKHGDVPELCVTAKYYYLGIKRNNSGTYMLFNQTMSSSAQQQIKNLLKNNRLGFKIMFVHVS